MFIQKSWDKSLVFVVSLIDINKVLIKKKKINLYTRLLEYLYKFLNLFSLEKAKKLSSFCRKGVDYLIKLEKNIDRLEKEIL